MLWLFLNPKSREVTYCISPNFYNKQFNSFFKDKIILFCHLCKKTKQFFLSSTKYFILNYSTTPMQCIKCNRQLFYSLGVLFKKIYIYRYGIKIFNNTDGKTKSIFLQRKSTNKTQSVYDNDMLYMHVHQPVPPQKKMIKFLPTHKKWFIKAKKISHAKLFFLQCKNCNHTRPSKKRPPPFMPSVWLHGASRKGLKEQIKEPKSVSKYHASSLRNHGKPSEV